MNVTVRHQGFTIIEMLISLAVLSFGLLAAGQLLFLATTAESLARSKQTASLAAQDRLESLADLYRRDSGAEELTPGDHGPTQVYVLNPANNLEINRYDVAWNVATLSDLRGRALQGRLVTVTVKPVTQAGAANSRPPLNKVVNMATIFSPRIP